MEITVKFFARARELAGTSESVIQVTSSAGNDQVTVTAKAFVDLLFAKYSRLAQLRGELMLAHNLEFVDVFDNTITIVLHHGDEVAVLPPVSGG